MNSSKINKQLSLFYVWLFVVVIIPLLLIIFKSFSNYKGEYTLENYTKLFDPVYVKMTLLSIFYAIIITILGLLISYPAAYVLSRAKHRDLWITLILIPTWINLLLKTYAFIGILSENGPINNVFEVIGIGRQQLLFNPIGFIIVSLNIFIPFMIIPIYEAICKIDKRQENAAYDLGASKLQVLSKVVIPGSLSGVESAFQIVFIPTLSIFMITRLIAGNKIINLGTAIEQQFLTNQNPFMGSAIAVELLLIMILVFYIQKLIFGYWGRNNA
jgi:spermidine/putrescine transport system permease protein